jgi:hypothetical protein
MPAWTRAVRRLVRALEHSPVLDAYRTGKKEIPSKPSRTLKPMWRHQLPDGSYVGEGIDTEEPQE